MAAIDVYLQEILDAVYGEEVRGAIHDAIQQVYTDGHAGVPTTRTINGHPLTNDITLTASDVGAVAKTGDTMTGGLTAPSVTISNSSYPRLYFRDGSNAIGQVLVNHSSRNISFREIKTSGNFDSFTLPTPTLSETSDSYYDILTSKSAVTVAQGGTGATTAANARANLGLTYKAGDSVTGAFCITGRIVNAGTGIYGALTLDKTITATSASFSNIGSVNMYTTDGGKTLTTLAFVNVCWSMMM